MLERSDVATRLPMHHCQRFCLPSPRCTEGMQIGAGLRLTRLRRTLSGTGRPTAITIRASAWEVQNV